MNRITSRVAARAGIRQIDAVLQADAAADAAERAVRSVWRDVLALLQSSSNSWEVHHRAVAIFRRLVPTVNDASAAALRRVAGWGHRSVVSDLTRTLPRDYLTAAAILRRPALMNPRIVPESHCPHGHGAALLEDLPRPIPLAALDPLGPFRDLAPEEPAWDDFDIDDFLFPSPPRETIDQVVFGSGWQYWLGNAAGTRNPDQLASIISSGFAFGRNPQEIARDLLPAVDGVRSAARRIARTEGMRIAGAMQMQAHDQLGDLCVGFQVLPLLDQHSRPWHAARKGITYWKNPKPGQKGLRQMPHPPDEPDDPGERPAGTPKRAHWCRCTLLPVLRAIDSLTDHPAFRNAQQDLIPDPLLYRDWFRQADERRRRIAVGVRRYERMKAELGRKPEWEHFLDPLTGDLVARDALAQETDVARNERVAKARAILGQRQKEAGELAAFGFVRS